MLRASRDGISVVESVKRFKQAFASIRGTIKDLIAKMDALKIEEGEVKFGLKALVEAGVFAVGKVGVEMNHEVTLKWKKPEKKSKMSVLQEWILQVLNGESVVGAAILDRGRM